MIAGDRFDVPPGHRTMPAMKRGLIMVMCVSAVALLGGCIQRTIKIESNPPGALVHGAPECPGPPPRWTAGQAP